MIPPVAQVAWLPCHRVVPSRYPPLGLFDRVADPADLEAVFAVEAMTNPRIRQEAGEISLVPPEDRVSGPGTSPIMAPFTRPNPAGSRFSDGSYGVYYAAEFLDGAIAETRYHRQRFMAATREAPTELDMRVYLTDLDAEFHDIRGRKEFGEIHDPDRYDAAQALGRRLRAAGSWGIAYDSVRLPGARCAAVFRPRALANCRQGAHLIYAWDGDRISAVYEKRLIAS